MLCFEINKVPGKPFCFVPLWGGRGTLEREQKVAAKCFEFLGVTASKEKGGRGETLFTV